MSAAKLRYLNAISPHSNMPRSAEESPSSSSSPSPHSPPARRSTAYPSTSDSTSSHTTSTFGTSRLPPSSTKSRLRVSTCDGDGDGTKANESSFSRGGQYGDEDSEVVRPSKLKPGSTGRATAKMSGSAPRETVATNTVATSSTTCSTSGRSRAVEARMSAAMAIYAASDLISDDDYFTAEGLLDVDRLDADAAHDVHDTDDFAITPTNAINAAQTGAPPPPTLGEIEQQMMMTSETTTMMATIAAGDDDGLRGGGDARNINTRSIAAPDAEQNGHAQAQAAARFEESFGEAFPTLGLEAFDTSMTTKEHADADADAVAAAAVAAPQSTNPSSPSTIADSSNKTTTTTTTTTTMKKSILHDPFGMMPSLQSPSTSISSKDPPAVANAATATSGAAALTSVAAKRRARANLKVVTISPISLPTPASSVSPAHASPTSMLDAALQGTPVQVSDDLDRFGRTSISTSSPDVFIGGGRSASTDFVAAGDGSSAIENKANDFSNAEFGLGSAKRKASPLPALNLDVASDEESDPDDDVINQMAYGGSAKSGSGKGSRSISISGKKTTVKPEREGLVLCDELSPRQQLEEKKKEQDAKKKKKFLSKMIMRGKKEKKSSSTPKASEVCSQTGTKESKTSGSVAESIRPGATAGSLQSVSPTTHQLYCNNSKETPMVNVSPEGKADCLQDRVASTHNSIADTTSYPPLDDINESGDSSDEENLVNGANRLASAMMELRSVTTTNPSLSTSIIQRARGEKIGTIGDAPDSVRSVSEEEARKSRENISTERPMMPPPSKGLSSNEDGVEATRSPRRSEVGEARQEALFCDQPQRRDGFMKNSETRKDMSRRSGPKATKSPYVDKFAERGGVTSKAAPGNLKSSPVTKRAEGAPRGGVSSLDSVPPHESLRISASPSDEIDSNKYSIKTPFQNCAVNNKTEEKSARDGPVAAQMTLSGRGLRTLSDKKKRGQVTPKVKSSAQRTERTLFNERSASKRAPSILRKSGLLNRKEDVQCDLDGPNIDPIQRAGIRLLSAAAIPIQTEVRRCLAQHEALKRVRALMMIQAYFRRWLAERRLGERIAAAARIQALFRGWLARDTLEDEHYCAVQLQRIVRRYIASVRVYKLLSDLNMNHKATMIQSAWRGYTAQLNYQFDVVDIIIVQSIARRYMACRRTAQVKQERRDQCAIKIQNAWRSYDCTMNYLHTLADILIAQSIVRRWMAMKAYPAFREHRLNTSAAQIQRLVRGHLSRNELMWYFTATEIQSMWRRYAAEQKLKKYRLARRIQTTWRGYVARRDYRETREYLASVDIQRIWHGYVTRRDYRETREYLAAVDIQRAWLGYVARKDYRETREYLAAVDIQRIWRGFQCFTDYIFTIADVVIAQRTARHWLAVKKVNAMREVKAATTIQSAYRGYSRHMSYLYTLVHIIIVQSVVRRRLIVKDYSIQLEAHKASRKIQAIWRGHAIRSENNDAAIRIQSAWRRYVACLKMQESFIERNAAIVIQKNWRGFSKYSDYVILRHEIIRIQALFRGYQERRWVSFQHECASVIQSGARCYMVKKEMGEQKRIILAGNATVMGIRAKNGANKIQRCWRHYAYCKKEKAAAVVIERFFTYVKKEVDKELARIELNKKQKRKKKRRKKKEEEDKLLERVWLNTVQSEDDRTRIQKMMTTGRPTSAGTENKGMVNPKKMDGSFSQEPASLSIEQVGSVYVQPNESRRKALELHALQQKKSELSTKGGKPHSPPPTETVHADDHSEVSGITSPTVFIKTPLVPTSSRFKNLSRKELKDDLSLEEAWIDAEVHQAKEKMRSEKKYIRMYGLDHGGSHAITSTRAATELHCDEKSTTSISTDTANNCKTRGRHSQQRSMHHTSSRSFRDPSGSRVPHFSSPSFDQKGKIPTRSYSPASRRIHASQGDIIGTNVASSTQLGYNSSDAGDLQRTQSMESSRSMAKTKRETAPSPRPTPRKKMSAVQIEP